MSAQAFARTVARSFSAWTNLSGSWGRFPSQIGVKELAIQPSIELQHIATLESLEVRVLQKGTVADCTCSAPPAGVSIDYSNTCAE